MFTHVVRIGVPHPLSGVRERPCIVHDSGRRTIRLPPGVAPGCTGQQRVDNAASLLVFEFVQHGTNERAQLGSRHRLEGPAEIRVSRSSTGRARTPTDHYSVPDDASHRRASLYLCASLWLWLQPSVEDRGQERLVQIEAGRLEPFQEVRHVHQASLGPCPEHPEGAGHS